MVFVGVLVVVKAPSDVLMLMLMVVPRKNMTVESNINISSLLYGYVYHCYPEKTLK